MSNRATAQPRRYGIRSRAMAVVTVLVLVTVVVAGLLVYHGATLALLISHREQLGRETRIIGEAFAGLVDTMRRDAVFVAQMPAIVAMGDEVCTTGAATGTGHCRIRATEALTNMLRTRQSYRQVGIIGIDGEDILHVHAEGGVPQGESAEQSHELRESAAYMAAVDLAKGQAWIADARVEGGGKQPGSGPQTLIDSITPLHAADGRLAGFVYNAGLRQLSGREAYPAARRGCNSLAIRAVQPVWCDAPTPRPVSPWKYS
ncbi:MAG: hypothetical protein FJ170_02035 [Gammaproteobacteria bacterium]|nr:hypothetical protein [Gammaproteobacteria bacterium]